MPKFQTFEEAVRAYREDLPMLKEMGIANDAAIAYLPEPFKRDYQLALDAQPALTTSANSGVPALMTTFVDPEIYEVLFTANKAAKIFGEVQKGTWLDETALFPIVEHTGEVSSYGDYNNNGSAGVNSNFPNRQSYLFQTIKKYGEREIERAGRAKIGWVAEIDAAAMLAMKKFENLAYFFGISGLQNYGFFNDPFIPASLTPAPKAAGGTAWIQGGRIVATANEIYLDIQATFTQLVSQSGGLVEAEDTMILAMAPLSSTALLATNSFNVNVHDLLKKNFPNLTVETAVQYGAVSSSNQQGIASGNLMQLVAKTVEGQKVGYCAFSEKLRTHPIIRDLSAFKQKITAGVWGGVVRQPFAIASMLGI